MQLLTRTPTLFPLILTLLTIPHRTTSQSTANNSTIITSSSLPFLITTSTPQNEANYTAPIYPILPFIKSPLNPILTPNPSSNFESAYLYNPTAIVLNDTIFLLYRAQNASKTSSIGLAWSTDGTTFTRLDHPILYATEPWETIGGCEDPRLIRVNGTFYMTYTAFNNITAQLCLATSTDLMTWTKYPPLFPSFTDVAYSDLLVPSARLNHTKSGAIVDEPTSDGLYHMYFGDSSFYHATSPDLINWTALPSDNSFASPMNPWENRLIEPGPAPIKTRDGRWLLIYNGMTTGLAGFPKDQYSTGMMLIDPSGSFRSPSLNISSTSPSPSTSATCQTNPYGTYQAQLHDGPIARLQQPLLVPGSTDEIQGQVDRVVFSEGLVQFRGKWWLYFGQGDSDLGVAMADVRP